jgi:hypothetical protein
LPTQLVSNAPATRHWRSECREGQLLDPENVNSRPVADMTVYPKRLWKTGMRGRSTIAQTARSPGGATDTVGRFLGLRLAEKFGQPFIVENRAGA